MIFLRPALPLSARNAARLQALPSRATLRATAVFTILTSLAGAVSAADFDREILPILTKYCTDCHSTEKQKGDLDLQRFSSIDSIKKETRVWESVMDQLAHNEMPPKDKPALSPEEKTTLSTWVQSTLDEVALAQSGDPGPVILRRLSNAEYTYTIRDLTGVPTLDPAQEFPVDGAAGEGFTNTGAALVMSPSLVTKYFDAAKDIASHAMLLPDGLRFSAATSQRDQAEECLTEIRNFYNRYTVTGGGTAVNLQGVQFNTADGGLLPYEKYLEATLTDRAALLAGTTTVEKSAAARALNSKYLGLLWTALNDPSPSLLLDRLRTRWKTAAPADAPKLVAELAPWMNSLWRFTQVGHIGKKNGPPSWQVPVTPLAQTSEVRLKMPPPGPDGTVTFYLSTTDAGDGPAGDAAVWENPRLTAPGRPDLALRDLPAAVAGLTAHRDAAFAQAAASLAAASAWTSATTPPDLASLAADNKVDPAILKSWLDCLGLGAGPAEHGPCLTGKTEATEGNAAIKTLSGADALGVIANTSDAAVRIPGLMPPHSLAMHPSPTRRIVAGWRVKFPDKVTVKGSIRDAHPECGNGVTWTVEWRRGPVRQRLATGVSNAGEEVAFGPFENISLRPDDLITLAIGPRDGSHVCDLTTINLNISSADHTWNVVRDAAPDLLSGNPHPSGWMFFSEPDTGTDTDPALPPNSILARWLSAPDPAAAAGLARGFQNLLLTKAAGLAPDAPDSLLYRRLASFNGPLLAPLLQHPPVNSAGAPVWGLDPSLFANTIPTTAPSVLTIRVPGELAEGSEFAATARLSTSASPEASVQMQVLPDKPAADASLIAGSVREAGGKSTWSDGEGALASTAPIIVQSGSPTEARFKKAFDDFRSLFPAALCYTKIVPVDEVVTLTLYHREDDQFRRLLLTDAESAELDRKWADLHFVSQDALKLVDAFEQLYQFATQDADPSSFEPMREPIRARAAAFQEQLLAARPAQVEAVLTFAEKAWRRPLTNPEKDSLRTLHRTLLTEQLPHDQTVRLMLARVLVAPAFLYRGEQSMAGVKAAPVSDHELATRLSYFLWSSAPDPELRQLAAAGTLRDPVVLTNQVRRLLRDKRVRRLAAEFGCQWLHIRDLDTLDEKSERHFPTFRALRGDMLEESIRCFTDFFQADRHVLSLLESDRSFVSPALAAHYNLPAPGDGWHEVSGLRAAGRGGILGLASTLAKQSGASRTSPILRGNWLCEVVLGDKLPRPPKGVPVLPDEPPAGLTERQLTERHSSDPNCAACHQQMDPFGYALEGFDAIGRARQQDAAGLPINSTATLPNGQVLAGLDGLRSYILGPRRRDFLHQFCKKLLGYSLGRATQLSDRPLMEKMIQQLETGDGRIGPLVELIVLSPQFLQIRGLAWPVD
ncbi:MAG: hypothetical protein JWL81_2082 [Verrucomicrobiales bacterium]|nr:hypothetical protein [Verrucomicrobiales bacterium]